jgi:hypothetical protein
VNGQISNVIMNNTTEEIPIEKLCSKVLDTRFENFDQATLDEAKYRLLDVIGCLIAGSRAPGNLALANLVKVRTRLNLAAGSKSCSWRLIQEVQKYLNPGTRSRLGWELSHGC